MLSFYSLSRAICFSIIVFAGLLLSGNFAKVAFAAPSSQELEEAVRKVLKENPALVLDVLKGESEAVLEVVEAGQLQRNRKILLAQWDADAKMPKKVDLAGRSFLGNANAPITIVGYSDYQCSYCRQAEITIKSMLQKYNGKVRFYSKVVPNTDNEVAVAIARYAVAAFEQDAVKAWAFHDLLFANAGKLARDGDGAIKEFAGQVGLDLKKLISDARSAKVAERLKADAAEAETLKFRGTPYFLVNDYVVRGSIAPALFEEVINLALKKGK